MSRISKELARQIAVKLTEKSRQLIDLETKSYRQLVYDIYDSQTPDEVKELFKKHPDYLELRSSVKLNGHGFNYESVTVPEQVFSNNTRYSECQMKMNTAIADKLIKAKRKVEKAKKTYDELLLETEVALLALRTFNNIRKEFPEASAMLPPPMSNALVVNFDSLRNRLKKQPEPTIATKEVTV